MGKYYDKIGFVKTVEKPGGVFEEETYEAPYAGNYTDRIGNWERATDSTNDTLKIRQKISIIADTFLLSNAQHIRYAYYGGTKWAVTSIDPKYPRVTLMLGGVYNGPEPNEIEVP